MKRQKLVGVLVLSGMFLLAGCGHEHVWEEATCEMPKHCTECEATEGEALEHRWKDATCTSAKTCEICGVSEGDPLPHSFLAASCVKAEECASCGETKGDPLAHGGMTIGICDLCGQSLNKDLVLQMEYRFEVAANDLAVTMTTAIQEYSSEIEVLTVLDNPEERDPDEVIVGELTWGTLTLGSFFEWADGVLRETVWENHKEKYEEVKAVYEDIYEKCADYPELSALKEKTKELIDAVPLTPPTKRERTGEVYDLKLSEVSSLEGEERDRLKAEFEAAMEQWMQDSKEDIQGILTVGTKADEWVEEYNKVKALFE